MEWWEGGRKDCARIYNNVIKEHIPPAAVEHFFPLTHYHHTAPGLAVPEKIPENPQTHTIPENGYPAMRPDS